MYARLLVAISISVSLSIGSLLSAPTLLTAQNMVCLMCDEIYSGEEYKHRFDSSGAAARLCEDPPEFMREGSATSDGAHSWCHNTFKDGPCDTHDLCGEALLTVASALDHIVESASTESPLGGRVRISEPAAGSVLAEIMRLPNIRISSEGEMIELLDCDGRKIGDWTIPPPFRAEGPIV